MTIQINLGDHVSPLAPIFLPVPFRHQWVTSWARQRAQHIAATMPSADAYFRTLPFGRSLAQLLADRTIWINYAPDLGILVGGTDVATHKEIGIAEAAYRWGRWTVLATLIHELTHSNGVPGKELGPPRMPSCIVGSANAPRGRPTSTTPGLHLIPARMVEWRAAAS